MLWFYILQSWASQVALVEKHPPSNAGDMRDPWLGKIPWRKHSNPIQCPCLECPTDRGTWWVRVRGISKSQTRLKQLSMRTRTLGGYHSSIMIIFRLGPEIQLRIQEDLRRSLLIEQNCSKRLKLFSLQDLVIFRAVETEKQVMK